MEEAKVILEEKEEGEDMETGKEEQGTEVPEMPALESLKKRLEKAITEERYEEAAQIRDEIKKLGSAN
jgi:protein-arginine kinase activator protein McsA